MESGPPKHARADLLHQPSESCLPPAQLLATVSLAGHPVACVSSHQRVSLSPLAHAGGSPTHLTPPAWRCQLPVQKRQPTVSIICKCKVMARSFCRASFFQSFSQAKRSGGLVWAELGGCWSYAFPLCTPSPARRGFVAGGTAGTTELPLTTELRVWEDPGS